MARKGVVEIRPVMEIAGLPGDEALKQRAESIAR